jgi:hypothetical protein
MLLNISISEKFDDELSNPQHISTNIMADLEDCDVNAYFKVFERVLGMLGFTESVIMTGAAELAFNEFRNKETMAAVANRFDLILEEDFADRLSRDFRDKLDEISKE